MKTIHNLLEGLKNLGNLGGDNSLFNDYLRGSNVSDMRKDWAAVGADTRKVMNIYKRTAYGR